MSLLNRNYVEAKQAVKDGHSVERAVWIGCKVIRPYQASDRDYIDTDNTEGLIIEECLRKECDCTIGLWVPTDEDKAATDYYIISK